MERVSRQDATSLGTYLGIARRRAWIVVLCAIVAPAVAYVLSSRQPSQYSSSAEVYVNSENIASALTGISAYTGSTAVAVDSQASLADVPVVARRALALAKVTSLSPGGLLGEVTITPNDTTNILTISVVNHSAAEAGILATSFARAFTAYSNALQSQPIVRARAEVIAAMASLQSQGKSHSALYTSLEEKEQELETLVTLQTSGTTIVRPGSAAGLVSPHPTKDAALGLVLGIVLGFGIAFGTEALDTRIRSSEELSHELGGLPLLARIPPPTTKMQKRDELAMIAQPKHNAAEAFRLLRANLEFLRLGVGEMRVILLTSAVEKEGKSTTAANLAIAEARSGKRVALVDLDLRQPYIDRFFHLSGAEGVTDVALGRIPLPQALQRIDLNQGAPDAAGIVPSLLSGSQTPVAEAGVLDVLVSGPRPPDPGEFVASVRLAEIVADLRHAYDTVIIDTPPALWVGDALTISTQADGVVVVARLKSLRKGTVRELERVLDVLPTRKLGFVITGPVARDRLYGAGDGYSYGYGYGYGRGNNARPMSRMNETDPTNHGIDERVSRRHDKDAWD